MSNGTVHFVAGVLAVEEAVLVLALLINLAHQLLVLLKLIVGEEYGEGLVLFKHETLSNHLQKLLESEIERDQIPNTQVNTATRILTSADLAQVTFARWRIFQ